jgi:transcriptional regulator with PAS, ATPase and Fis domain
MTQKRSETAAMPGRNAEHHHVLGARLVVIAGPDTGKSFVARSERVVVGSEPGASLELSDRTVSRFHCELELDEGRILVRDLGSKNGTSVDHVKIVAGYLHDGATLQLGASTLKLELSPDNLSLPVSPRTEFGLMVGASVAMRRVFALLERAADSDATVLLQGETGTGKEVAAESIHLESARKNRPFIVVDCAALPAELLEAELFGHERGAFTGATHERAGLFEEADGGTVFLDEIGELPLSLQPKLLRVLERRELRRVGGSSYKKIDLRIIAATNRDLRSEVNEKRFRSDLFYRLAVLEVRIPPLRERPDDLPALLDHLLLHRHRESTTGSPSVDPRTLVDRSELLRELTRHPWPGNVRELRNYIERCVALRQTPPFEASTQLEGAELRADVTRPLKEARESWNRALERSYVQTMLERHEGNVAAAARAAGVDRMYFYRLLWRHGLR